MKNRREFLKFLGIGAGAAASVALAVVAGRGGTPVTPPRAITDIEAPKPYVGPDGVPGGDFIQRKPDILRDWNPVPEIKMPTVGIDVAEIDKEMAKKMVDNVFDTSPLHQYLTTTGTQEINTVDPNVTLTIDSSDLEAFNVVNVEREFYDWSTVWDEMAPDRWGRNE